MNETNEIVNRQQNIANVKTCLGKLRKCLESINIIKGIKSNIKQRIIGKNARCLKK